MKSQQTLACKIEVFSQIVEQNSSEMARQEVFNVNDQPRYNFKSYPYVSLLDDPLKAFLQISKMYFMLKTLEGIYTEKSRA